MTIDFVPFIDISPRKRQKSRNMKEEISHKFIQTLLII